MVDLSSSFFVNVYQRVALMAHHFPWFSHLVRGFTPLNMVISYSYVNVYQAGYFAPPIPSTPAACWHGSVPCWATPRVFSSTAPLRAADSSPPHWSLVPVEIMEKQREKHWKNGEARQLKIIGWSKLNYWLWGGWKTMSFVQGKFQILRQALYMSSVPGIVHGPLVRNFFCYAELPFLFTAKLVSWFPGKDGWNLSSRRGSVGLAIGGWLVFFPIHRVWRVLKPHLVEQSRSNHPPVSLGGEI